MTTDQEIVRDVERFLSGYGSKVIYSFLESCPNAPDGPRLSELSLPEKLKEALKAKGIDRLYKFQYKAIEIIRSGKNLMIVSGTGTGKTEAFLVPLLERLILEKDSNERPSIILIYPTKALARDQALRIRGFVEGKLGFKVSILDGDTPKHERLKIYSEPPHILITNPDMLHVGMALSENFKKLISKARTVVLDEIHVYKGVFGSHVKWVLYRLKRLANNEVQFIGSGATIGNPEDLGRILFDDEVIVVKGPRRKGSAIHILVGQGKVSRWTLTAALISYFVRRRRKVLSFVDSQQMAELIARIAMKTFGVKVGVHRAGLLPEERRRVEKAFWSGEILAVISTPTLELGIDIGDLDVVVMPHLPRSFSSYIQRAGRVGRRGQTGLVITVLGDDPIEAYFSSRPREFFSQEIDPSYVEPYNREVLKVHLAAMLLEGGVLRLTSLSNELADATNELVDLGIARRKKDVVYPVWKKVYSYLSDRSNLRSSGPQVRIYDGNKLIGYREMPQALYDLYPGAIYYHSGRSYLSVKLDIESLKAIVRPIGAQVNMYTKPLYVVDLITISPIDKRKIGPLTLIYGDIKIMIAIEGYVMKEESSGITLSEVKYEKPITWTYWTKGVMTRYPTAGIENLTKLISGYHALEHVLISASKPVIGASDTDLGGISYPTGHIVIYDSAPGGHGASRLIFERFEKIESIALKILGGCTCDDGCPRCVYSPYCGSGNKFLSRRSALRILSYTLELKGRIPEGSPEGKPLA